MKKIIYIILVLVVILGVGIWWFVRQRPKGEEIYLSSGGANWTPEQNRNLQESLININGKYLEAVLATNSVFSTNIEGTTYDEWRKRLDKAIKLWDGVEESEKRLGVVLDDLVGPAQNQEQGFLPMPSKAFSNSQKNKLIPIAYAEAPELGAVTAVFDSAPAGQRLRRVMEVFSWDRKKAFYYLKQEQGLLTAEAWTKAADTYKRWEMAARAIKDASKVTVFVGANIITAGGATTAVTLGQGITVAVGGVSLAMEVGEDVYIAIGSEKDAAVLHKTSKKMGPIADIITIASFSKTDPGNLFWIKDKGEQIYNWVKKSKGKVVHITVEPDKGKIVVSDESSKDVKIPDPLPSDKIKTAGLPEGKYRIDGEAVEAKEEPKKPEIPEKVPAPPIIKNINAIGEIAAMLANFKAPPGLTVKADSTKITTGDANTLIVTIPEGFSPPFTVKIMSEGGSGGGIALPSKVDSRIFTGEFISSNPGTFVPRIQIIDANGKVISGSTTICVEGEEVVERDGDVTKFEKVLRELGQELGWKFYGPYTPPRVSEAKWRAGIGKDQYELEIVVESSNIEDLKKEMCKTGSFSGPYAGEEIIYSLIDTSMGQVCCKREISRSYKTEGIPLGELDKPRAEEETKIGISTRETILLIKDNYFIKACGSTEFRMYSREASENYIPPQAGSLTLKYIEMIWNKL